MEYIERDAVINDIGELFTICYETLPNECGHHFVVEKELQTHLDFVRSLPAADVVPVVRGTWLNQEDGACFCSVCHLGLESFVEGIFYNYCPFCGADMKDCDGE